MYQICHAVVYVYEKEIGRTTTGLLHFFLVMKVEGREKKPLLCGENQDGFRPGVNQTVSRVRGVG